MTVEMILGAIILILCGLLGWEKRESRLERAKLINALVAQNAQEMVNLELSDKTKIKTAPSGVNTGRPDLIPENELDDETFSKLMMEGKLNG